MPEKHDAAPEPDVLETKKKQTIDNAKIRLEVLEKLLADYDKTYSLKIQTWKEKTNQLISS